MRKPNRLPSKLPAMPWILGWLLGSGRTRQRLMAPHCPQSHCALAAAKTSRQAACSKANKTLTRTGSARRWAHATMPQGR